MPTEMPEGTKKGKGSHQNTQAKANKWPFWLLLALVVLTLGGFAYVLTDQWLSARDTNGQNISPPASNTTPTQPTTDPVSILPDAPEGVTIIEKQPDLPDSNSDVTRNNTGLPSATAPIAQGAEVATGFAMDLGSADAFLELSQRFATIAQTNGAENFQRLEPRAVLRETVTGLEARLLVGPFETSDAAAEACSVLILDPQIECVVATFEGELIPRE